MAPKMSDAQLDELSRRLLTVGDAIDDALISTDLHGAVVSWNKGAERLYGYTAAEMIGQPIARVFLPDRADDEREILERIARGEAIRDLVGVRRHRDGHLVPTSLSIWPVLDAHGRPTGTVGLVRDRRKHRDPAARRLATIVETSDDAILSKDLNGIITSWNAAAERMFGYTAPEMIGQSVRRLIPDDRQEEEDHVLAAIRRGERVAHFETLRQRKDGSLLPISLTVSPLFDDDGIVIGASKIARDISDRRAMEAERVRLLADAEETAAVTERLNQVGTVIAGGLNRDEIVQAVTDAATELTHAAFGAFFYNVLSDQGESYTLYTISGAPREAFSKFPMPRNTRIFSPTFHGEGPVRCADVTTDPRYGHNAPFHGMPTGHLPVRSYLAVPVKARSGEVLGGLFFGHPDAGRFSHHHEQLAVGIATWASIALENARLYVGVQEASRLKDEFLATLSHELRTPLNAILGYSRMICAGIVAPERQQKAMETIARNATSLTQIVEDVLDVSRIISGKLRLHVQPVDVPAVVETAVDSVVPAAEARGVRLEVVIDPLAAPISGDPERLQQIVWNLMSNAVKFTNRDGKVQVEVQRVNSHVEVTVSDTGIGISRAFLPHIFERFRQADAGTTRERGGLGLGLSITRHLVEMHGGTIEAFSEGEGKGSSFRVSLPLMVARHGSQTSDRSHPRHERPQPALTVPDLSGIRVMAVDDDHDALLMIRDILQAAGAEVSTALSAAQALDTLEAHPHDVLLSDLGMPQMDGFGFIGEVRRSEYSSVRSIPAAALTAYARSEDRARALRSGFQLHLSKPIDPAELMAAIAALTKRTGIG